ncbi:hypothetical protein ABIC22_000762 [Paenibacillus sp. PvP094]|uniref:hypothetical protein n=1 Tax=Paenibacillus sp. PvP094 TaxID=3156394 RepID=UPI0033985D5A
MNEPKTPNLGLNKIDRSSPSTTYFDLDKYLDQNWEKVDAFAEQVEEKAEETAAQVSNIQERLDTEKRRSVTLEPGLQIINAERASAFKLEGLKGRTLVNLLGRIGRFGDLSNMASNGNHSISVSAGNKIDGDNTLTITNTGKGGVQDLVRVTDFTFENDAFYIGIMNAKADVSTLLHSELFGTRGSVLGQEVTTEWKTLVFRYLGTTGGMGLHFWNDTATATTIYINELRLFKVKSAEYIAPDADLIAKYPYVDSVQPVRNPYAIRYGENLLPPLMGSSFVNVSNYITGPYEWINPLGKENTGYTVLRFRVTPNTDYTLNAETFTNVSTSVYPLNLEVPNPPKYWGTELPYTFNSGNNTELNFLFRANIEGEYATFKNPMLTIGKTPKPFKPREDTMLALQTDLFADPLTGTNADEVFEKDGQYFKAKKWTKFLLNDTLSYSLLNNYTGFKRVLIPIGQLPLPYVSSNARTSWTTKYDGKLLNTVDTATMADSYDYSSLSGWLLSIFNADSGWGDSYTPTADEIKAYFMGWVMYQNESTSLAPYNGTGTKAWSYRASNFSGAVNAGTMLGGTTNIPTQLAPSGGTAYTWVPYQLVYQLATPTVEPITSEGQLTFIEGNNQAEVGTGIMLREYSPTPANSNPNLSGRREINFTQVPASLLKNKARSILAIYRNRVQDHKWTISNNAVDSYGTSRANTTKESFDPSAAYTVTYLMLDKSPLAPFVGSVPDNEKALLTDLVQGVQQANARISVVESKKAEKDVAYNKIYPTLLNGWTNYGDGSYAPIAFYKDNLGFVHLEGLIKGGVISSGAYIFKLPKEYIPPKTNVFLGQSSDGSTQGYGRIDVRNDGNVVCSSGYNGWLSLSGISFLV